MSKKSKLEFDSRNADTLLKRIESGNFSVQILQEFLMTLRRVSGNRPRLKALTDLIAHNEIEKGYFRDRAILTAKGVFHEFALKPDDPRRLVEPGNELVPWARDLLNARLELEYEEFIRPNQQISKTEIGGMIKSAIKTCSETGRPMVSRSITDREKFFISALYTKLSQPSVLLPHHLGDDVAKSIVDLKLREAQITRSFAKSIERQLYILTFKHLNQVSLAIPSKELYGNGCLLRFLLHPTTDSGPFPNPRNEMMVSILADIAFEEPLPLGFGGYTIPVMYSDFAIDRDVGRGKLNDLFGKTHRMESTPGISIKLSMEVHIEITEDFKLKLWF